MPIPPVIAALDANNDGVIDAKDSDDDDDGIPTIDESNLAAGDDVGQRVGGGKVNRDCMQAKRG